MPSLSSLVTILLSLTALSVRGEERAYFLSDSQWAHLVAGEVRLLDRTSEESGGNLYDPVFTAKFLGARLTQAGLKIERVDVPTPFEMTVTAPPETHEKLAAQLAFFNQSLGGIILRARIFAIPLETLQSEDFSFANADSPFAKVILQEEEVDSLIAKLTETPGVDLLTAPTVIARSANRANVEVVRELVFASEFDPPKLPEPSEEKPTPVVPASPSSFESRNIGVTCHFFPRLELDGTIQLDLALEDTRFLGFVNYGNPITTESKGRFGRPKTVELSENRMEMPVFTLRRFEGSARLRPGGSLIVGGMAHEEIQEVEDGREFPLIGKKRTWMDSTREALFFVITASVVDEAGKPVEP